METNMSWITRQLFAARMPLAMVLALTMGGAGCQSDPHIAGTTGRAGEDFLREDETSAVTRLADRQIAVGARTDATLRPYHFRHAGLNALGREKLDFMLADGDVGGDLVVYLDLAGDPANRRHDAARADAVADYLTSRGLAEGEFRLEPGFNPYNTMSAAAAEPKESDADADASELDAAADEALGAISDMLPN
jgi:hypothetical protein